MKQFIFILLLILSAFSGCKPDEDVLIEDEDINLGGQTSISGSYIQAFEQPAANLSTAELDLHRKSDKIFESRFVTAPNLINGGVGPVFNQNACANCHTANGRSPFPTDPNELRGLLFRLSIDGVDAHGGPLAAPNYGGQLQTKAIYGTPPEAQITWHEEQEIKTFIDGEQITLSKPVFSIINPYVPIPGGMLMSPRLAPPVIGLGLVEAISESDILALADPNDADGNGISGKANYVWDEKNQIKTIGRFGWKAGQPNLLQQTAAAANQDMGVTSPYYPEENCSGQIQADTLSDDPEIDANTLKMAAFYPQSLGVPQRRNTTDPTIINGKNLFMQLKCDNCHHPKYITGQHPEYAFLSNQKIYPYSDFLLHDMGDALADNRPDFEANGKEWRTPPLWGLGLTKTVGGPNANFLHDGRAKNLQEAIMWHGGEAENSKESFRKLNKAERESVINFLESL